MEIVTSFSILLVLLISTVGVVMGKYDAATYFLLLALYLRLSAWESANKVRVDQPRILGPDGR